MKDCSNFESETAQNRLQTLWGWVHATLIPFKTRQSLLSNLHIAKRKNKRLYERGVPPQG